MDGVVCWKCGMDISGLPQPLGRRAECPACHVELHVCRLCRHYDPVKARQCREPMAEEIKEKTRANFCEWFQPRAHAFQTTNPQKANPRNALEALFGGAEEGSNPGKDRSELDRLFGD